MSRDRTGTRSSTGGGSITIGMTKTGGSRRNRGGTTSELIGGKEKTKGN